MEVRLDPGHIVLDENPAPPPQKGAQPPIFGPFLLWPNCWMHQDATWYGGRPRPRPHCTRWGPSCPFRKGHSPQFSAHLYCGQTARWIKMALGMEVGLGSGHIVLDGDPAAPAKGAQQPLTPSFRPVSIVATVAHLRLLLSSCRNLSECALLPINYMSK